ncbi:MAG: hypothetical protein ACFE0O_01995 [Opitutales bacterium]
MAPQTPVLATVKGCRPNRRLAALARLLMILLVGLPAGASAAEEIDTLEGFEIIAGSEDGSLFRPAPPTGWAYTQHARWLEKDGRVERLRVMRYNPQEKDNPQTLGWTLLSADRRAPSIEAIEEMVADKRDQRKHRDKNRKLARQLIEAAEVTTAVADGREIRTYTFRKSELPLQHKYLRHFTVIRSKPEDQTWFDRMTIEADTPFRYLLIFKLDDFRLEAQFDRIGPPDTVAIRQVRLNAAGSILLNRYVYQVDYRYTDYEYVGDPAEAENEIAGRPE